jgi:hypothetical protein
MTWTGCYIGANVGGAWGRFTLEGPFGGEVDRSTNNASFVGGGQIGCDYQFAGGWVIGFRNMFDGTTNSRDRTFTVTGPGVSATGTSEFHMRWFDALTGRIGYSWQPNQLVYFQGGAVWSRLELCPPLWPALQALQAARLPLPKPAGRLAVAGNIDSRRSGRCLSKAITTTSARVIEL